MHWSKWLSALIFLSTLRLTNTASIPTATSGDVFNSTQRLAAASYIQVAYFTNWGIYGPDFQPTDIDPSQLTHILYAFADVTADTGMVFLTDRWADEQKLFPGDSQDDQGNNLYGCLKQLYLLKLAHRHLKVLLSVGGWSYSQDGHFSFVTQSDLRANFVASAIQLVKDYGFDGIDIDFEYPANAAEGQGFLALMASLRNAFDELAVRNGDTTPYELTAAVPAGAANYAYYLISQLDSILTYWNLMAYDYAGSWLTYADNQANLYGGSRTGVSTDAAVKHYISSGATPGKIVMGIPLYGRAFENTDGIGRPYDGTGPGTYSYKSLPLSGAQVYQDSADVASYSYDSAKRELVSYDDPEVVRIKVDYVKSHLLGGCMFWELSTDRTGAESLVQTAGLALGQLDQTSNHIHYPNSKWENIRNNMSNRNSSMSPTTTTTTTMTMTTATNCALTASATSTNSCLCADVSPWATTIIYTADEKAVYDDRLWTAKWWTEGDVPGGTDAWKNEGMCH